MIELKNIDHIGIAVNCLDESIKLYELLGFRCEKKEEIVEQKVYVAFLPCGESELELLEPTDENSPVQKFIDKKGEGLHHIAIRVDDVQESIKMLKDAGVRMIDEAPRYGAGGAKIAFIHPKMTKVLIELCERK
jgi:methylmalonyl-CoA epimerase